MDCRPERSIFVKCDKSHTDDCFRSPKHPESIPYKKIHGRVVRFIGSHYSKSADVASYHCYEDLRNGENVCMTFQDFMSLDGRKIIYLTEMEVIAWASKR